MPPIGDDLDLPNGEEQIAFRAFESVLRTDPVLRRVVKTWSSWKGEASDLLQPCPALCPYVQLVCRPAGGQWATEGQHKEPVYVGIYTAVRGLNQDNLLNLWAAIRRAVFPLDPARDELVKTKLRTEAKVSKPTLLMPAIEQAADVKDAAPNMLITRGLIELHLLIPT